MLRITLTHNTPEIVARMQSAPAQLLSDVDRGMARGAAELAREMRATAPKDSSQLTNAIAPRRVSLLEHTVVAAKHHASYQEEGSGPGGWPSFASIESWIRRKGITARSPGVRQRDLPFLIRRSIAARGVPATHFAQRALTAVAPRLDILFRTAVANGVLAIERGRAL